MMSNSALVAYKKISPNRTSPRNHVIDTITIHVVVGQLSVESIGKIFADPAAGASSNYGIGSDGRIGMYVEEKDRSWCSSNKANDHRAITIEVASDTKHPYKVNDKAYAALIELVADICRRNDIKELRWKADKSLIGQVDKQNMTAHRWFANKACPGDYLYSRFDDIAAAVNKKLGADEAPKKSVEAVAKEVLAGKWGNGSKRKKRLQAAGYDYNEVQAKVKELKAAEASYKVGKDYTLQANLKVRTGPGTGYRWKNRSELSKDGQKNAQNKAKAVLKKGTKVTCQGVQGSWMKIPSGWICCKQNGEIYVK